MLKILDNKLFRQVSYFFIWLFLIASFSYYQSESLLGAFKYLIYFSSFLFFLWVLRSFANLKIIYLGFFTLVLIAAFLSIFGFYQFFTGVEQLAKWDDPNFISGAKRVYSVFGNPNLFGAFLVQAIAINIALFFDSLDLKSKLREVLGQMAPFLMSVSLLLNLGALFLTGSRSSMIGVFICLLLSLLFLLWTKKFNIALMLFLTLLGFSALIVFLNPSLITRFQSLFMWDKYSTNEYRLEVWGTCLEMIKENWVLGIGLGNEVFRKVYALYMKPGFEALSSYSIFLEYLIQAGALGLILFLSVLKESFASLFSLQKKYPYLVLMIGLALIGLMVQGLFDTVFFRPQVHFIFWLLIASIVTLRECYLDKGEHGRINN